MSQRIQRKRKNPQILRIRKNFYDILRMHLIRAGLPHDSHSIASVLGMTIEQYTASAVELLPVDMKIEDYKKTWAIKPIRPLKDFLNVQDFLHHSNHSPQWIHKSAIYQDTNHVLTEQIKVLVGRLRQNYIVLDSPQNHVNLPEFTRFVAGLLGIQVNQQLKASLITAMHMHGYPLTQYHSSKLFKGCALKL